MNGLHNTASGRATGQEQRNTEEQGIWRENCVDLGHHHSIGEAKQRLSLPKQLMVSTINCKTNRD